MQALQIWQPVKIWECKNTEINITIKNELLYFSLFVIDKVFWLFIVKQFYVFRIQ